VSKKVRKRLTHLWKSSSSSSERVWYWYLH